MKIFIIGGSGLVGGNCFDYIKNESDWEVVASHLTLELENTVYFNASNLNDPNNFDVENYNPDVIIHCAALTWVDYCQEHKEESFEKSVVPARNAIELSKTLDAKLIFISTDYIFDGEAGPYSEVDIANPLNVYGEHKLLVEEEIKSQLTNYLVCRITNVFGKEVRGKNFIARLIKEAQLESKVISLPTDQYSSPVYAYDVAKALCLLLANNKNGTYHLSNGEYLNRYELAQIALSNTPNNFQLQKINTQEMDVSTPRPLKGGLKNDKFLREFPKFKFLTVEEYVSAII